MGKTITTIWYKAWDLPKAVLRGWAEAHRGIDFEWDFDNPEWQKVVEWELQNPDTRLRRKPE